MQTAFLAKLQPAVEDVAKQQSLAFVFNEDTGVIVWAEPSLDITPQIVARLAR
jgi:Skp family chaperone for outer membrane proteins